MVVTRPNHVDAIGIDAAHQANLLSLLSMERKDGIEPTNRTYDAIALERMRTQLSQIGRMAHGNNRHAPDALARQCGHQIQVMAEHQIGPKLSHRPIDCISKCPLKCLEHRRRQVTNISKMAQEKGCAASVEKISDAEWHVTVTTAGAVAVADPEQDGAAFCDANAGKGKLVISVYTDCMGRGDDELGHKLMKAFIFAVTQQEELPATMLFYNGGAKLTVEGSPVLDDLKGLAEQGVEILTCGTCLDHYGIKDQLAVGEVTNMYMIVEKMEQAVRVVRP